MQTPLFFQRRFWPMWTALSLGTFSDNVLRQALLIGIPYGFISVPGIDRPDDAMPLIGALLPLAILLFSPISGQLADKYETSMMFRRTKFVEVLLMIVAGAAFLTSAGALAVFMLFAMGAQSAFFSPVRVSAMPKYLAADELVRGNGLCNAGLFTFILLGYVVGGFLIAQPAGGGLVAVTLVTASTIGWLAARNALPAPAGDPQLTLDLNAPRQAARMFRFVFEAPGVAPPLVGVGAFFLLSTAVTVVLPLFARDSLNADPYVATALNGLFAIGAGLGAVTAASLAKGRSGLGFSTASVIAAGVLTLAIYAAAPFLRPPEGVLFTSNMLLTTPAGLFIAVAFVATAGLMGVYIAPLQAAMQRRAPKTVRARIMAASAFANAAFAIPGSLAVMGVTRTGVDPATAFVGVGLGMLAIGAYMLHRRQVKPAGLYDEDLRGGAHPGD